MNNWTEKTLRLRTQGDEKRFGFSPSAPDDAELAVYLDQLALNALPREALVMGMTAGLRQALLQDRYTTVCVDSSADAIQYLQGSVSGGLADNETVLHADWRDMDRLRDTRFPAIVGDGVFGVLQTQDVPQVLAAIHRTLLPQGALVTRMLLIPTGFDFAENTQDRLIEKFRSGETGVEDFAMGMRLWANFDDYYEKDTQYYRNAKAFARLEQLRADDVITAAEHLHITRRYYGGNNYLPHEADWENAMRDAGFTFTKIAMEGHDWYQYMPIYVCRPKAGVA